MHHVAPFPYLMWAKKKTSLPFPSLLFSDFHAFKYVTVHLNSARASASCGFIQWTEYFLAAFRLQAQVALIRLLCSYVTQLWSSHSYVVLNQIQNLSDFLFFFPIQPWSKQSFQDSGDFYIPLNFWHVDILAENCFCESRSPLRVPSLHPDTPPRRNCSCRSGEKKPPWKEILCYHLVIMLHISA